MTHLFSTIILCIAFPTLHQDHWALIEPIFFHACVLYLHLLLKLHETSLHPLIIPLVAWISPLSSGGIRISKGQDFTWSYSRIPSWNLPRILNHQPLSEYVKSISCLCHPQATRNKQAIKLFCCWSLTSWKKQVDSFIPTILDQGWKNVPNLAKIICWLIFFRCLRCQPPVSVSLHQRWCPSHLGASACNCPPGVVELGEKGGGQHLENKNLNDLDEKHGYKIRNVE